MTHDQLFADPLVTATRTEAKNAYPDVHFTCGLSNISFGMPLRPLINKYFLVMAVQSASLLMLKKRLDFNLVLLFFGSVAFSLFLFLIMNRKSRV